MVETCQCKDKKVKEQCSEVFKDYPIHYCILFGSYAKGKASESRAVGLSLGNWQLIINIVMLIVVLIFKRSLIGFGTIFNMVLIGYYVDFFDWIWGMILPADTFSSPLSRWVIFFVTLFGFIISAAIYINSDMGVAPYDGIPILIGEKVAGKKKIIAMTVRILWDAAAICVGMLAGGIPVIGVIPNKDVRAFLRKTVHRPRSTSRGCGPPCVWHFR